MSFLYKKTIQLLRKDTRVIDAYVVNFYLVKIRYKILGFFQFTINDLITDINVNNVKTEDRYRIEMAVKAAEYTILSNNADLMIDHTSD